MVEDPGAAIDTGLNVAVVPLGSPVALRAIAELKPPELTVEIVGVNVLFPLAPGGMVNEFGEAVIVNAPTGVTVRETVAVCVVPPLVPVIVIVYVPVGVLESTAIVIVEEPEPGAATDVGLNLTVTPDG
jgi:hypothetical protein